MTHIKSSFRILYKNISFSVYFITKGRLFCLSHMMEDRHIEKPEIQRLNYNTHHLAWKNDPVISAEIQLQQKLLKVSVNNDQLELVVSLTLNN